MSLRFVVDMNLSPEWVAVLTDQGWPSIHWSQIGDATADDTEIMAWAQTNNHVVFTHDLDFGTMLALTLATGSSVLQVRSRNVLPEQLGPIVIAAIRQHESELAVGALVVVDEKKSRVRVLPL